MLSIEIHLVTNMCVFNDIQSHFHKTKEQRLFYFIEDIMKNPRVP